MYGKIIPMLDIIEKMIHNNEDKNKIIEFTNTAFPKIKKDILFSDIATCTDCDLYACNHVLPEGPINSEIMFVAEAPGAEEEKQGKPFVGPSGHLFDNMLKMASEKINPRWDRKNIYITNIVKCRPSIEGNRNRTPNTKEIATCKKFIDKEIQLVKPKVVICMGSIAASVLIYPNFKITKEHGKMFGEETKYIGIYHPSYVLRKNENSEEGIALKTQMWKDLLTVENYLNKNK